MNPRMPRTFRERHHRRTRALSASEMILLTLRFVTCNRMYFASSWRFFWCTANRVINKVIRAIAHMHEIYITLPEEEINIVRQGFFNISRFPRCIGAVDCTHIKIQSPGGEEPENFRNRRDIVCGWPRLITQIYSGIQQYELGLKMENLVGDSGYGNKSYVITPLSNPSFFLYIIINFVTLPTFNCAFTFQYKAH